MRWAPATALQEGWYNLNVETMLLSDMPHLMGVASIDPFTAEEAPLGLPEDVRPCLFVVCFAGVFEVAAAAATARR